MYIINRRFKEEAERRFNPRNAMYISKNDGMFNNDVNHCRDTLVNANGLIYVSRDNYTEEQLEKIRRVKGIS